MIQFHLKETEAWMTRVVWGVWVVALAMVSPAWAQSGTGVTASLVGDIVRTDGGNDIYRGQSPDGEAFGFSLRLDQALGTRWGVELEYVRGGELEVQNRALPYLTESLAGLNISAPVAVTLLAGVTSTATVRYSTVSTLAWYRQPLGDRAALVYSAGIGFGITRSESTFRYIGLPNENTLPFPPSTNKYTSYGVNPVVGVDARIAMTDHASIVPGIRLFGGNGGIILRPSVGIRWGF